MKREIHLPNLHDLGYMLVSGAVYIPETQMTLVLIIKDLVFEGPPPKQRTNGFQAYIYIIYMYIYYYIFNLHLYIYIYRSIFGFSNIKYTMYTAVNRYGWREMTWWVNHVFPRGGLIFYCNALLPCNQCHTWCRPKNISWFSKCKTAVFPSKQVLLWFQRCSIPKDPGSPNLRWWARGV